MSFTIANLSPAGALGNNRNRWHYYSSDTMAVVVADDYFAGTAKPYFKVGDILEIVASSGAEFETVTVRVADGTHVKLLGPSTPTVGLVADSTGTIGSGTDNAAALAALSASATVPFAAGKYRLSTLSGFAGQTWIMEPGAYPVLDLGGTVPLPHLLPRIAWRGLPHAGQGYGGHIGDSRSLRGVTVGSGATAPTATSSHIWTWVTAASQGAVQFDASLSQAVGGTKPSDLDGQITLLLAAGRPSWCGILTGTNDLSGVTVAQQTSYILNAWFRLLGNGIRPLHILDLPRQLSTTDVHVTNRDAGTNQLVRRLGMALGVFVYDSHRLMVDATNASGDPITLLFDDGIHQSAKGANLLGSAIGTDLKALIAPHLYGLDHGWSYEDRYDATYNPYGNLVQHPSLRGTGGFSDGTVTGSVATGVYIALASNASGVASIVTAADGRRYQQLVITKGSSNKAGSIGFDCDGVTAGKTIRASVDVITTNLDDVWVYCDYGPAHAYYPQVGGGATAYIGDVSGRLMVPDHVVPASQTTASLSVNFNVFAAGATTQTIKVALPVLRPVT